MDVVEGGVGVDEMNPLQMEKQDWGDTMEQSDSAPITPGQRCKESDEEDVGTAVKRQKTESEAILGDISSI